MQARLFCRDFAKFVVVKKPGNKGAERYQSVYERADDFLRRSRHGKSSRRGSSKGHQGRRHVALKHHSLTVKTKLPPILNIWESAVARKAKRRRIKRKAWTRSEVAELRRYAKDKMRGEEEFLG